MTSSSDVDILQAKCQPLFDLLADTQSKIRSTLSAFADGKTLKGDELVGWLGEIYGKLLLGGSLVHDREEHDFLTPDGKRVSVKTRKGTSVGWRTTSSIPKIDGEDCPTHLMFVHLQPDYSIDRVWLFSWLLLYSQGRFKEHIVRGARRSWVFRLDESRDEQHVIYRRDA